MTIYVNIIGEIYYFDTQSLEKIGKFEGYPNWYFREKMAVMADSDEEYTAWFYFNNKKTEFVVKSGNLSSFLCKLHFLKCALAKHD